MSSLRAATLNKRLNIQRRLAWYESCPNCYRSHLPHWIISHDKILPVPGPCARMTRIIEEKQTLFFHFRALSLRNLKINATPLGKNMASGSNPTPTIIQHTSSNIPQSQPWPWRRRIGRTMLPSTAMTATTTVRKMITTSNVVRHRHHHCSLPNSNSFNRSPPKPFSALWPDRQLLI